MMSFQVPQQVQHLERSTHTTPDVSLDQKRIKVLIPSDGSETSEVALNELARAGLPKGFEAFVAVTDVWLPSSPYEITRAVSARRLKVLTAGVSSFAPALRKYEEQRVLSREAEQRIHLEFPAAPIRTEALQSEAAVANEVIRKATQWGAELIIVGAKAGPSPHITDYAGPALKIAKEADCSVRIARASARREQSPIRFIIGLEEPESSAQLVGRVMDRVWPSESEAHLFLVRKPGPHDPTRDAKENLLLQQLAKRLRAAGLRVSFTAIDGQPEEILERKARELAVDCIFIHATGDAAIEESLSAVAQALVLGATCSVEVVRSKHPGSQEFRPAA